MTDETTPDETPDLATLQASIAKLEAKISNS